MGVPSPLLPTNNRVNWKEEKNIKATDEITNRDYHFGWVD